MASLERAIEIAVAAHRGQVDKSGQPYILHPLRVMLQMHSETEQIAAVLHDTVEDSSLTLEDIENEGFSHEIVNAIRCLTRNDSEPYAEFVSRAKTNPVARAVKRADIEDNMNLRRLGQLSQRDLDRLREYHKAWKYLEQDEM